MSSPQRSNPSRAADDSGSAVVEFVLVAILLLTVTAGVLQLALTLHVRNILLSSASEGAHVAALADATPADGVARAVDMATASLGGREVSGAVRVVDVGGADTVEVALSSAMPILRLWGAGEIRVTAHAPEESDA